MWHTGTCVIPPQVNSESRALYIIYGSYSVQRYRETWISTREGSSGQKPRFSLFLFPYEQKYSAFTAPSCSVTRQDWMLSISNSSRCQRCTDHWQFASRHFGWHHSGDPCKLCKGWMERGTAKPASPGMWEQGKEICSGKWTWGSLLPLCTA